MLMQPGVHTGTMELMEAGNDPELLEKTKGQSQSGRQPQQWLGSRASLAPSALPFLKFICLFWAALGLRCCFRAFSSRGEQGLLPLRCTGFLQWLLLLQSMGP